jgi:ribonuclease-3 family protein
MDAYQMTSQSLAYLGDAVLEVKVREYLVKEGLSRSAVLNRAALSFVTAARQSEAVKVILPLLTEEETDVFKRGKNSHLTPPKSASLNEYKRATGFECVFGFLHLTSNFERIDELFRAAYGEEMARLKENDPAE